MGEGARAQIAMERKRDCATKAERMLNRRAFRKVFLVQLDEVQLDEVQLDEVQLDEVQLD
jgi:hypothetical protein